MGSYKEKADREKSEIGNLLSIRKSLNDQIKVLSDIRNLHYRFAHKKATRAAAGKGFDVTDFLPKERIDIYNKAIADRDKLRARRTYVSYQIELKEKRLKSYQNKIGEGGI